MLWIVHYCSGMSNTLQGRRRTVPDDPLAVSPEHPTGGDGFVATPGQASASTVQSVDRAVTVLEILARAGEAGVTQIAGELGVHKSTAFRLVSTLELRGLVEQHAERGKYRLGMGILPLAGATTARLDLVQEARPLARALALGTGETVNIAVLSDGAALYLDQFAGSSSLQPHNWVGQRIPLHATSNGKVLLAWLDPAEADAAVRRPLKRFTPSTITTLKQLRAELDATRDAGYARAVDEMELGLTAVAAPIFNMRRDVIASLSVSGPSVRLHGTLMASAISSVRDTAVSISERLGSRQE